MTHFEPFVANNYYEMNKTIYVMETENFLSVLLFYKIKRKLSLLTSIQLFNLGDLETGVETLTFCSCSHCFFVLPNFHECYHNFMETRKAFAISKLIHHKIPIISRGLIIVQNAFLLGLFSEGIHFQRGLLLEGNLIGWTSQ